MRIQTVHESKIYREAFNSLSTWERLDANWGYDKKNTRRWPLDSQERMDNWIYVHERITFIRQNLSRANSRGVTSKSITIKLDEVYKIGEEQGWKCAYTNEPLEFTRGGDFGHNTNPLSCTIDRIDSDKGYVKGNIQLISWIANCAKNAMTHDQFIELCKKVAKHH
jgi:hypothetical protein